MPSWGWCLSFVALEQCLRSRDDLGNAHGTLHDVESEVRDLISGDRPECRDNQNAISWNDGAHFLEHLTRFRQSMQIDNHHARLHSRPEILPWNGPGISGHDVVSLFEELSPQQGALRPFGTEQDDFRRLDFTSHSTYYAH
jgi:hypothetical protein